MTTQKEFTQCEFDQDLPGTEEKLLLLLEWKKSFEIIITKFIYLISI
jgi:hypothetical protein